MTITLNSKVGGWDTTGINLCADGLYWTRCLLGNIIDSGIKAFPGAEGVGTSTAGGSGGTLVRVTTLADSGAGSYREALTTSGVRTVVFDVSGTIDLLTEVLVVDPNLTISGQTSPGGIIISGARTTINTNNVIVRFLRFRIGEHNNQSADTQYVRALQVNGNGNGYANPAFNVVIDHCSFSWTGDQALTIQEDAYNTTVSWCYMGEALDNDNHAFNYFYWGKYTQPGRQFSSHHNVTTHSRNRNPEINFNGRLDHYNNVNYNSIFGSATSLLGWADATFSGATNLVANLEHNYNKMGPSSSANTNKTGMWLEDPLAADAANPLVYLDGNLGAQRTNQGMDNNVTSAITRYSPSFSYQTPADVDYLAGSAFTFNSTKVITPMTDAYAQVIVDTAGANVPVRDTVDARLAKDFTDGTGTVRQTVSYPTDWPDLSIGAPALPTDSNGNGIPDAYETFRGETIGSLVATDLAPSGYTWLREYHNQLGNKEYTP